MKFKLITKITYNEYIREECYSYIYVCRRHWWNRWMGNTYSIGFSTDPKKWKFSENKSMAKVELESALRRDKFGRIYPKYKEELVEITTQGVTSKKINHTKITKELLEKNGFKISSMWHDATLEIDDYRIRIQFGTGGVVEYIDIFKKGKCVAADINIHLPNINLVCQVEDLFKLCGIKYRMI